MYYSKVFGYRTFRFELFQSDLLIRKNMNRVYKYEKIKILGFGLNKQTNSTILK